MRRARVAELLLAMGGIALVAAAATPARASQASCGKLLAPASGVYFGGAPDFVADPKRLEGDTVTADAIDDFEQKAGRQTIWAEFSQHWFEDSNSRATKCLPSGATARCPTSG